MLVWEDLKMMLKKLEQAKEYLRRTSE